MNKTVCALAFIAPLVAVFPRIAFGAAVFNSLSFFFDDTDLNPVTPIVTNPPPVGTRTSISILNTFQDSSASTVIQVSSAKTGVNPTIFGDDAASLDQIGLTDAVIKYTRGTGPLDLIIDFGFEFTSPSADSQTYGLQIAGSYSRGFGLATNDSIDVGSSIVYSYTPTNFATKQIATDRIFNVTTSNTFGPPNPTSVTQVNSCAANKPSSTSTCLLSNDVIEMQARIHFDRVGDSVKIPNSLITVWSEDGEAVQAFLDAAAAADAAELAAPEPSVLVLLLSTGLAGLGLHRLKHVRARLGQDRHD